jgi:hypothetical protein
MVRNLQFQSIIAQNKIFTCTWILNLFIFLKIIFVIFYFLEIIWLTWRHAALKTFSSVHTCSNQCIIVTYSTLTVKINNTCVYVMSIWLKFRSTLLFLAWRYDCHHICFTFIMIWISGEGFFSHLIKPYLKDRH